MLGVMTTLNEKLIKSRNAKLYVNQKQLINIIDVKSNEIE